MEGLSKEYMIKQVKAHKDLIRDATDRLSDILYRARVSKNLELNEKDSLAVRKTLHEIVSELSMIGGYCDGWTKNYIDKTVVVVGRQASLGISYAQAVLLDWWAMRINGIIIDFNKTPFRLSQLKPILSILEKVFRSRE